VVWPDIPQRLEKLLMGTLSKHRELRPTLNTIVTELGEVRGEIADRRNLGLGLNLGLGMAAAVHERSDSFPTSRIGMTSGPVPRITTTAMSSGVVQAPRSRWKPVAVIGGLATIAAVLLVMVMAGTGGETGSATSAASAVDESPPAVTDVLPAATVPDEPTAPLVGMVTVSVNVDRPMVVIDGDPVDITRGAPIELVAGEHRFEVSAAGYVAETQTVAVGAGAHAVLDIELERVAQSHTVRKPDRSSKHAKPAKKKKKKKKKKAEKPQRFDAEGTIDPFSGK
jgi:hypothetical protein